MQARAGEPVDVDMVQRVLADYPRVCLRIFADYLEFDLRPASYLVQPDGLVIMGTHVCLPMRDGYSFRFLNCGSQGLFFRSISWTIFFISRSPSTAAHSGS